MAMARDGLLPTYFEAVSQTTQVPVRSTVWTGVFTATLAFFMDVSQLAGMVSAFLISYKLFIYYYFRPGKEDYASLVVVNSYTILLDLVSRSAWALCLHLLWLPFQFWYLDMPLQMRPQTQNFFKH